nr:MAG TPA: hypothetical protein [Bacteriophage sp.]
MITSTNVANNFLERAFEEKITISPMKIQKLVYILYKEYLKETGNSLFSERFEAWQYGPVLPNIYSEFKGYGGKPITNYGLDANKNMLKVRLEQGTPLYEIFNNVWSRFKHRTGTYLSNLTHQADGAWRKAVENKTYILTDEDIKEEPSYEQ